MGRKKGNCMVWDSEEEENGQQNVLQKPVYQRLGASERQKPQVPADRDNDRHFIECLVHSFKRELQMEAKEHQKEMHEKEKVHKKEMQEIEESHQKMMHKRDMEHQDKWHEKEEKHLKAMAALKKDLKEMKNENAELRQRVDTQAAELEKAREELQQRDQRIRVLQKEKEEMREETEDIIAMATRPWHTIIAHRMTGKEKRDRNARTWKHFPQMYQA